MRRLPRNLRRPRAGLAIAERGSLEIDHDPFSALYVTIGLTRARHRHFFQELWLAPMIGIGFASTLPAHL